jgi:hypothetical protein
MSRTIKHPKNRGAQMKTPLVDRIPFTKIVTVLAICAGGAVGLCGVGFAIGLGTKFSGTGSGGLAMELFLIPGGVLFWGSLLGLVLVFVLWVVLAIAKAISDR